MVTSTILEMKKKSRAFILIMGVLSNRLLSFTVIFSPTLKFFNLFLSKKYIYRFVPIDKLKNVAKIHWKSKFKYDSSLL